MHNNMPAWLKDACFYEIYPQSFKDSNGDGIGDFNGIIQKLDYIKELGCNCIWMNPCFDSPFLDAGYDISNFYLAAPRYGTNEDLKNLFDEVHKRDMHIILDLVPGHTSLEHKWFKESVKHEKNEFTDRYIWTNSVWNSDGLNCIRGFSERDGCCMVNYFSHQPALNYGFYNPDPEKPWQLSMDDEGPRATLEEMKNVMRFWLQMGCDGFRVDMAGSLVKGDTPERDGSIKLWQNVRKFLDAEFPDSAIISEWGNPSQSIAGGFHMDFLLHFGPTHYMDLFRTDEPYFSERGKGNISEFVAKYIENYEQSNKKGLICIPSGNHDMLRIAKFLSGDNLKIAFAFILSMPGAPFIYYGDEIGMKYIENLLSLEGGYHRTGSRTPMQWDDSVNAGFSTAPKDKLYLEQDESTDRPTAKAAIADENSLYHEIKRLIKLRNEHEALQNYGEVEFVYAEENAYPFVYLRSSKNEKILVILNPSGKDASFESKYLPKEAVYTFGGKVELDGNIVKVPKQSFGFYKI